MAMRTDCKYYESRTYPSGDTMRKCRIDLAPEAPWRCPENCPKYDRRTVDVAWQYGSLKRSVIQDPDEPPELGEDVSALLDSAEDIVNAAGDEILAEVHAEQSRPKGLKRLVPRGRKNKGKKRKKKK